MTFKLGDKVKTKKYLKTFRYDRLAYLVGIVMGLIVLLIKEAL